MFVTNDNVRYERVLTISKHGRSRSSFRQFWPARIGVKYKMSNIQAAVCLAQGERIEDLIAGKRRVFKEYERRLSGLRLTMNPEPAETVNLY
jgi:perosamine synthetase